ncbi:hypothetical protein ACROYT_G000040 [Oculina patagonica]
MAAIDESERECRELLTDALINNQVHNTYTMDEFKELFPRKYRDHRDVKLLYEAYQTKRKQIRDRVLMNIRQHCRHPQQQVKSAYYFHQCTYKAATKFLFRTRSPQSLERGLKA